MLLGLTGLKGSGKDTVAAYLIKEYGFERKAFADKLKQSAAALFGINPAEFETLKNDESIRLETTESGILWSELADYAGPKISIGFREFLQRYGTESHRDVFGYNFWVDQVLPVAGYYADRDIVITDVRYFGESERIKNLKGYVVRVVRGNPMQDSDTHSSEADQVKIEADYELDNNGTMKYLPNKVDEMLVELKLRKALA